MVWDSKGRFFTTFLIALFMLVKICAAQAPGALNPYKPLVDRLESIVGLPLDDWRYHADVAHPEDSSLDDKEWPVVKTGEAWKTGPRVLRRRIEVPAALHGYSLWGARIRLELAVDSNDFVTVTVFSNGAMVSRTDADTLQPIVLTENAQPGDTFLVAIRVQAAENNTKISGSRLLITPPMNRPDPGIFTQEILAAQPMVAADAVDHGTGRNARPGARRQRAAAFHLAEAFDPPPTLCGRAQPRPQAQEVAGVGSAIRRTSPVQCGERGERMGGS